MFVIEKTAIDVLNQRTTGGENGEWGTVLIKHYRHATVHGGGGRARFFALYSLSFSIGLCGAPKSPRVRPLSPSLPPHTHFLHVYTASGRGRHRCAATEGRQSRLCVGAGARTGAGGPGRAAGARAEDDR